MKPRPTMPKIKEPGPTDAQGTTTIISEVSADEVRRRLDRTANARVVYVRNDDLTQTGLATYEEAKAIADDIMPLYDGKRDGDVMRVRICFRSRTGLFDVVVKTPKAVSKE